MKTDVYLDGKAFPIAAIAFTHNWNTMRNTEFVCVVSYFLKDGNGNKFLVGDDVAMGATEAILDQIIISGDTRTIHLKSMR